MGSSVLTDSFSVPLEILEQIDRVCIEFERCCLAGAIPALGPYLPQVADPWRPALFRELLRLDLAYRANPRLGDYVERYPEFAELARSVFSGHDDDDASTDAAGAVSIVIRESGPSRESHPQEVGNYRIIRELGRGGMGVVYKAVQAPLGRHVALKVMAPLRSSDTEIERFRREAEVAGRLHHTNIVPIFEAGQHGDLRYYAMQYIPGHDLHQFIKKVRRARGLDTGAARPPRTDFTRGEPVASVVETLGDSRPSLSDLAIAASEPAEGDHLTEPEVGTGFHTYFRRVAEMGAQVALALSYAHAQGIVHRDIKPTNLLLDARGTVWITDFGLVKTSDSDLTSRENILGTLRYLPPERLHGVCDARSDIYSLGLTLYELTTLEPAFDHSDQIGLLEAIQNRQPRAPRSIDSRIPRDLETIITKSCQKRPSDRYQRATDLAEDLRRFLAGEPTLARPIGPVERAWIWSRRRPLTALGVSLFFAALVLIAVLSVMFARTARRHADELSDALFAVQKSEALSRQSDETARREELRAREAQRQSDRVAARLALANALSLAELGSVDRALFEMLRALEIAPADPDLESLRRVVRTNLVAWQRQTPTLLYAFNLPGTLPTRAQLLQSGDGGDRNLFLSKRGDHGAFVTVGYDRMIRRWSFGSGTAIGPAFRLSKNGVAMSVSGDGKRLATSRVKNEIQNLETGEIASAPVTQHERDGQRVFTPMCFAGASVIATTSENPADQGKFCFWDEHTAREFPIRLSLGLGDCYEVIEGKDGQPLLFVSRTSQAATTPDPRLEAWDLRTGVRLTFPFPLPDIDRNAGSKASGRYFVALPLGERLRPQLYTDRQGPICTWDLDTGKLACPPWTSPVAPVYQLLTGEGRVLAVQCRDDRIRLFDLETGQQLGGTLTIPGMVTSRRPSPTSLGMALSTGGDVLVTLDRDCTVRGWDLNEVLGQARHAQRHLPSYLPPDRDSAPSAPVVAVTQDGSRVFFGRGDTGHVIDTQTRQPVGPGIVHPVLNRAHFSPDGNYLATATTATPRGDPPIIRIWDLRGDPVAVYESPKFIYGLRYSPDSRLLAVTGVGGTVVLNAHDGKVVRTLREQSCAVNATFSPDGRLLAVAYQEGWEGNGAGRRIWTVETGEPASAFLPADDHSYGAAALEFAANGHALLSLDPATNEVLRFDSADTKNAGTKLSANRPNMMAAWPALDLIATANAGGSLEVWTILDGRRRWVAPSSGEVRRLQLSPDGKTLAVVGSDQSVRLWDTATGWTLGPPFLHPAEIADLAFSSDGEALVTATRAGQVFRWSVPRPMSGSTLECSAAIERKLGMAARSGELVLLKPQEWQSIALPRGGSAGSSTP